MQLIIILRFYNIINKRKKNIIRLMSLKKYVKTNTIILLMLFKKT